MLIKVRFPACSLVLYFQESVHQSSWVADVFLGEKNLSSVILVALTELEPQFFTRSPVLAAWLPFTIVARGLAWSWLRQGGGERNEFIIMIFKIVYSGFVGQTVNIIWENRVNVLLSKRLQLYFSECNRTHVETPETEELIHRVLPNWFQSHLMCAGIDIGNQGSCFGDSGGPLMKLNRLTKQCKETNSELYLLRTEKAVNRDLFVSHTN